MSGKLLSNNYERVTELQSSYGDDQVEGVLYIAPEPYKNEMLTESLKYEYYRGVHNGKLVVFERRIEVNGDDTFVDESILDSDELL